MMTENWGFKIERLKFEREPVGELNHVPMAIAHWPFVYLLHSSNNSCAYIGESTNIASRLVQHMGHPEKKALQVLHLLSSKFFNKSAVLDIEANLIRYMQGDGIELLNSNLGQQDRTYFQQSLYEEMFEDLWDELRSRGVVTHSLDHIRNTDLFKYSPYKCLSNEQQIGLAAILDCLLDAQSTTVLVEGSAGTGKTILATFLFKMLLDDSYLEDEGVESDVDTQIPISQIRDLKNTFPQPKIALVIPMSSFRTTMQKVFASVGGLNKSMVISPAQAAKGNWDILFVDESHRLRRRVNLGAYFGGFDKVCNLLGMDKYSCSELDWLKRCTRKLVLFYDSAQSIRPSDTKAQAFNQIASEPATTIVRLTSQFRVRAGNDYVSFVDNLLNSTLETHGGLVEFQDYELSLSDSIVDLVEWVQEREDSHGLSRMVAGYSWKWASKNDRSLFDITIDGHHLRWNSQASDWINSATATEEVGCIHTTQGYDLNYAGIIFGKEISYDKKNNTISICRENYHDKNGKRKDLSDDQLKKYILNIYKTLLLRGIRGVCIYVCDLDLREYFANNIPALKKPKKYVPRYLPKDSILRFKNSIPVYDLQGIAGGFGEFQSPEIVNWLATPNPNKSQFACTVVGESMNKVIPNGSLCLFEKDPGGSRNGKIVLVECRDLQDADFGGRFTVKEYKSVIGGFDHRDRHRSIQLKPISDDPSFETIVLEPDEGSNLRVIGVFQRVIWSPSLD